MAGIPWAESYLGRVRASAGDTATLLFVGARGLVFDDAGRLLLIQRSDNHRWALPAGAMELGESIADSAVREVYEETGLTVQATELLGVWEYELGAAGLKGIVIFYRGRIVSGTAAPADDVEELGWFDPEAFPEIAFETHRQIIAFWQGFAGPTGAS